MSLGCHGRGEKEGEKEKKSKEERKEKKRKSRKRWQIRFKKEKMADRRKGVVWKERRRDITTTADGCED